MGAETEIRAAGAHSLSAVLIVSKDPARLVAFYRDALGLAMVDEIHDDTDLHWGCELGPIHFAIHPTSNFEQCAEPQPGGINMAFNVPDAQVASDAIEAAGYQVEYAPKDLGWCIMTAVRDPDGNYIELTQFPSGGRGSKAH
ncbi:MAG TPA: VOC family protein [Acidimicrobiia bacterium]